MLLSLSTYIFKHTRPVLIKQVKDWEDLMWNANLGGEIKADLFCSTCYICTHASPLHAREFHSEASAGTPPATRSSSPATTRGSRHSPQELKQKGHACRGPKKKWKMSERLDLCWTTWLCLKRRRQLGLLLTTNTTIPYNLQWWR